MALGLVFACMKKIKGAWGAGAQGVNYCADATTLCAWYAPPVRGILTESSEKTRRGHRLE